MKRRGDGVNDMNDERPVNLKRNGFVRYARDCGACNVMRDHHLTLGSLRSM